MNHLVESLTSTFRSRINCLLFRYLSLWKAEILEMVLLTLIYRYLLEGFASCSTGSLNIFIIPQYTKSVLKEDPLYYWALGKTIEILCELIYFLYTYLNSQALKLEAPFFENWITSRILIYILKKYTILWREALLN